MFGWFKPKNKRNIVVPVDGPEKLQGLDLVLSFTTPDEPKLVDFPKEQYPIYWEIMLGSILGGYQATLRFYSYVSGPISEHVLTDVSVPELRKKVTQLILLTMNKAKKT